MEHQASPQTNQYEQWWEKKNDKGRNFSPIYSLDKQQVGQAQPQQAEGITKKLSRHKQQQRLQDATETPSFASSKAVAFVVG